MLIIYGKLNLTKAWNKKSKHSSSFSLTLSAPDKKKLFGTTFTFNILNFFRKQIIE